MKLKQVWESPAGWQSLSGFKKNPKLSYRLLKYEKKVEKELEIIRKQQEICVYEAAGLTPPTPPDVLVVSIPPTIDDPDQVPGPEPRKQIENPQHKKFHDSFNAFLEGDSDLPWIGITMEDLIEGIGDAGKLSENDLERLEPFFTEPPPPTPTVH